MFHSIEKVDDRIIAFMRKWSGPVSRAALFVVYFWFGALKVFGASPATPMVLELQHMTLPFISPATFLLAFGVFEMLIGIGFIIPRWERVVIPLMVLHMISTALPLVLLPHMVWTAWFVPTLEGQYIIKNVALVALAMGIAARLAPLSSRRVV